MNFDTKESINQVIDKLLADGGNPKVFAATIGNLILCLDYLKSKGFSLLVDIFGVDYPQKSERVEIIYILLNMKLNKRFHVKLKVNPKLDFVPTTCEIFKASNWFEREVFDMYGVRFSDHPNLKRILTDYGFDGYPMLKDFPLTGYKEVRYDLESKEVIYEDVNLSQEYRNFDFLTPWEGTKYIDEVIDKNKK